MTAFDDDGQPVPTTWPTPGDEDPVLGVLLDTGLPPEQAARVADELEAIVDSRAVERAGLAIAEIIVRLGDDSSAALALQRVISGDDRPLRDAALGAGVSHVAIHKAERKIRRRIFGG